MFVQPLTVTLAAILALQSYPPPFPRTNATKLSETDRFVVWDIVWPKGQPTELHRHVYDQVGTYYQRGDRRITNLDGSARTASTQIGAISNTRKGTTHVEEGISDVPLRAVFIEMKHDRPLGSSPPVSDRPPMFPRPDATRVQDDERVTVWDYTWSAPGAAFGFHTRHDTVVVALAPGKVRLTRAGTVTVVDVAPGHVRVIPRGTAETDEAVTGQPRAMVFELK